MILFSRIISFPCFMLRKDVRTQEDVRQILELATIKETDLNSTTQCLYPMQSLKVDDLMLLEVDKHIWETLKEGDTYVSFTKNCYSQVLQSRLNNLASMLTIQFLFYRIK